MIQVGSDRYDYTSSVNDKGQQRLNEVFDILSTFHATFLGSQNIQIFMVKPHNVIDRKYFRPNDHGWRWMNRHFPP